MPTNLEVGGLFSTFNVGLSIIANEEKNMSDPVLVSVSAEVGEMWQPTLGLRWKFVPTSRMAQLQQLHVGDKGGQEWVAIPVVDENDVPIVR